MTVRPRFEPRTAALVLGAAALAIVVMLVGGGDEALATHVGCGQVITTDTTLDSNLFNCPDNGIVIGADGVTLNLNGHLIDGDETEFPGCGSNHEICDTGVVDDGHDGVTVINGRIRGFAVGLFAGGTTSRRVRHARVLGVSSVKNRFLGFGILSSVGTVVRNSSGSRATARHGGVGIALADSRDARIAHNSFRANSDHGIFVVDASDGLIKRNLFSRTATGVLLLKSDRNRLRRNRIVRVGEGIEITQSSRVVVARNRVSHAGGRGKGGSGIGIEAGRRNLVAHNVIVGAHGPGIRLGLTHPRVGTAHNIIRGNSVRRGGGDGFQIKGRAHRNLLKNNTAVGTGDDGIDVNNRTTNLTGNRALLNADLGIEAVRGVLDGGGNLARDNGDPRQCLNVVCS